MTDCGKRPSGRGKQGMEAKNAACSEAEGVSAAQAGRYSDAVLKRRGCVLFIASICEKFDLLKKSSV